MTKELTREQLELRSKIYMTIYWTCSALILLWYVLKSTGVIKTPLWIELLPVALAIFGAGAVFQEMRIDIRELKKNVSILTRRADHFEKDMHYVRA